ncbi:S8 family serine peptidase [Bacillus sp. 17RED48]|uniref:S8 family peptidase n=1 Tax=Bacillus sp. 17RED48 TaxID=2778093 RepID=UPI001C9B2FBE|nr:S8 family serine peptidase [Bacillus sp. 17RED48]MBY7114872.1 S8 family serine peptidase [Bacillus sp. 17RED48]
MKKLYAYLMIFLICIIFSFLYNVQTKENSTNNKKIKVAIVDSGIKEDHPALAGKIVKQFNAINSKDSNKDVFGHGTAIAGIIINQNTSNPSESSKNVELYDVKVLSETGKGEIKEFIKGIEWCIKQDVDIMNISFGVQVHYPELEKAINKAIDSGIIVVAASGNTFGFGVDYPAKYKDVISISSVDKNFKRPISAAKGKIDFVAPGEKILSTDKNGGYSEFSGTSFAAAYASNYIAELLASELNSKGKDINSFRVKELLINLSKDLGVDGFDSSYGYGVLIKKE